MRFSLLVQSFTRQMQDYADTVMDAVAAKRASSGEPAF
jgi:hypothetical protein